MTDPRRLRCKLLPVVATTVLIVTTGCGKSQLEVSQQQARQLLQQAENLIEKEDYERAMPILAKAIEHDPQLARAYHCRAEARLGDIAPELSDQEWQNQFNLARSDVLQAVSLGLQNAELLNLLGFIHLNLGEIEQSEANFSDAIALKPNWSEAYSNRALARQNQARLDLALRDAIRAVELDPNSAIAHERTGKVLRGLKRYDESIRSYTRAITLEPQDSRLYNARGLVYSASRRYEQALDDYNQAIKLAPGSNTQHVNRGIAYEFLGQEKKALAEFSRAIELAPDDEMGYRLRGELLIKLGEAEAAEPDLRKAAQLGNSLPSMNL